MKKILFLLTALIIGGVSAWADYTVGTTPISTKDDLTDGVYALQIRTKAYTGWLYYAEDNTPFRVTRNSAMTAFANSGRVVTNTMYLWKVAKGEQGFSLQCVNNDQYISNRGATDAGRGNVNKVGVNSAVASTSFVLSEPADDNGVKRFNIWKTQDGQVHDSKYPYLHTNDGNSFQILSYWEGGNMDNMNDGTAIKVAFYPVEQDNSQTLSNISEISNSKIYYIANERGGWAQKNGDHAIYQNEYAYAGSGIAADKESDYQRWAIIKGDNGFYIYNMGTQEWINANNSTSSDISKTVEITASGVDTKPFYFNATGKYMAVTNWNAYGWKVFTYGDTNDEGNKFGVYEVEDLSTEMQATLEAAVYDFEHNFAQSVAALDIYFNSNAVFTLSPAAKEELNAEFTALKAKTNVTKSEYDNFKAKVDAAAKVGLTTGYYFLKSHHYPTRINTASVSGNSDRMTAQENATNDLGAVALINVKENGKITIHYQGLNINTTGGGASVNLNSNGATEFTVSDLGGFAQIGIENDTFGYLHCGQSRDYGFCTWSAYNSSEASSWDIVPVETINVNLTDLSEYRTAAEGEGNYWTTVFVPFNFTTSNAIVYGTEQQGDYLHVEEISEATKGEGYVINAEQASATLSVVQPAVETTNSTSVLSGTFFATAPAEGSSTYVFSCVEGKLGFYKFAGSTLAANKAYYVPTTTEVQGFVLNFGGEQTTGVSQLSTVNCQLSTAFDLQGRRVNANVKGISIQNNKKVIR